ncbi:hypothetical protein C8J57DRAFT_1732943 [Mycena rebaudengoi]|nr:hypothetical protein C8J57DRAFT_1732943 [Mycena rebaudengoi]
MAEIFMHYVGNSLVACDYDIKTYPPLLLAGVCRTWREIALSFHHHRFWKVFLARGHLSQTLCNFTPEDNFSLAWPPITPFMFFRRPRRLTPILWRPQSDHSAAATLPASLRLPFWLQARVLILYDALGRLAATDALGNWRTIKEPCSHLPLLSMG